MKRIEKASEPKGFVDWNAADKMAHRPNWNRVPAEVRQAVHKSLIIEQGFLCCYCESRIERSDSHVEHFRPKSKFGGQQLDYRNLHCSCQRELQSGEPRHCGTKKGNWFDEDLLVSPLESHCEERFLHSGNGDVCARDDSDDAAKETILRLGLNIPKLRALRSEAIDTLTDFSDDEIRELLQMDRNGKFIGYWSAVSQVFGF